VKLENVTSEGDLRNWLSDHIDYNTEGRLKLEWIEPNIYGSSIGGPDVKIQGWGKTVGLELKYLLSTKKGIKWAVRPSQRRYHHLHVKQGGRSALMAYIAKNDELVLVRGDHIPLRDYAKDVSSGCAHGLVKMEVLNFMSIDMDRQAIFTLEDFLFENDEYWRKDA
jgi:hypothetical protein